MMADERTRAGAGASGGAQRRARPAAQRRRPGGHPNGAFLISTANDASSRAMIAAALPHLGGDSLEVLIGGLGSGLRARRGSGQRARPARDGGGVRAARRALVPRLRGGARGARRRRRGHRARPHRAGGRRRSAGRTVAGGYDLVALDTDNGPEWLVRDGNAGLYSDGGLRRLARAALRPGGAAVFWSPDRYPGSTSASSGVRARAAGARPRRRRRPSSRVHHVRGVARSRLTSAVTATRRRHGSHLGRAERDRLGPHRRVPDTDPLDLNFVDLHRMIVDLPSSRRSPGGQ